MQLDTDAFQLKSAIDKVILISEFQLQEVVETSGN